MLTDGDKDMMMIGRQLTVYGEKPTPSCTGPSDCSLDAVYVLRESAEDADKAGHRGWGFLMRFAAGEIQRLRQAKTLADLPAVAGNVRRDVGRCGNCKHFDSEDISGSGWCAAADHATTCDGYCCDWHDDFYTPNAESEDLT